MVMPMDRLRDKTFSVTAILAVLEGYIFAPSPDSVSAHAGKGTAQQTGERNFPIMGAQE